MLTSQHKENRVDYGLMGIAKRAGTDDKCNRELTIVLIIGAVHSALIDARFWLDYRYSTTQVPAKDRL